MVKHAGESTTSHLTISPKGHRYFGRTSDDSQSHETLEKLVIVIEERFPVAP